MTYTLVENGIRGGVISEEMPCRARLNTVLNSLFFGDDWKVERSGIISGNVSDVVKFVLKNKKEYKTWKKVQTAITADGIEQGLAVLTSKMEMAALSKVITGQ